ncbi:MAG: prepilin-type N-terminal cleavage/methylation domain-containing protein, partial [Verrucomicrobiota bacterium]
MNTSKDSKKKKRSAFTLLEILIATFVMALLVGVVLQITTNVLGLWNSSTGRLSANYSAQVVLDLVAQDLESAIFRADGNEWLHAYVENS